MWYLPGHEGVAPCLLMRVSSTQLVTGNTMGEGAISHASASLPSPLTAALRHYPATSDLTVSSSISNPCTIRPPYHTTHLTFPRAGTTSCAGPSLLSRPLSWAWVTRAIAWKSGWCAGSLHVPREPSGYSYFMVSTAAARGLGTVYRAVGATCAVPSVDSDSLGPLVGWKVRSQVLAEGK